jgi:hypothetical protein
MLRFIFKLFFGYPAHTLEFLNSFGRSGFTYEVLNDYGFWVEIRLGFWGVWASPDTVPKRCLTELESLEAYRKYEGQIIRDTQIGQG